MKGTVTDQYGDKHGGNIVTAVDGSKMIFLDDLVSYIENNKRPGDNMTITVHRDNHDLGLRLTLGEKPSEKSTFNNTGKSPEYP